MRSHRQFSFRISITLVKICFYRMFTNRTKHTFQLVGTVLKARANGFIILLQHPFAFVERCWLPGWAKGFNTSTFHSTKLHERPGIQSQAAAAVVNMDTSLRDLLVRMRVPNNVEWVVIRMDTAQADNPKDTRARDVTSFWNSCNGRFNWSRKMFHKNFKSRCFFSKIHFMDSQINKVHSPTILCVVLSDLMGFWDASISSSDPTRRHIQYK